MTVIVAVEEGGRVYMGADSQGSSGWDATQRLDEKLFRLGDAVVGFTGSYRMGQIIRYLTKPPTRSRAVGGKRKPYSDLHEALVHWVSGDLRTSLRKHGYTRISDNREQGGEFIVAWGGRIFCIESDFQVAEPATPYYAAGCGAPYAMGALDVLENEEFYATAYERLDLALGAAERFSNGVGGPFTYMTEGA